MLKKVQELPIEDRKITQDPMLLINDHLQIALIHPQQESQGLEITALDLMINHLLLLID